MAIVCQCGLLPESSSRKSGWTPWGREAFCVLSSYWIAPGTFPLLPTFLWAHFLVGEKKGGRGSLDPDPLPQLTFLNALLGSNLRMPSELNFQKKRKKILFFSFSKSLKKRKETSNTV